MAVISRSKDSSLLTVVITTCLFLLILFLLPTLVGGVRDVQCNDRGYRNATDGLCTCINPYYGAGCEFKNCPFGASWFSQPIQNNVRNMPLVPCSNMGYCDPLHGTCYCRDGFEGSACQRTTCATTVVPIIQTQTSQRTLSFNSGNSIYQNIHLTGTTQYTSVSMITSTTDLSNTPQCSGHGICKTMREAGAEFNGISLIRAPVSYNNWDADKIQGCICDSGWEGYDCSLRSCPKGRDPVLLSDEDSNEVYEIQCQASGGFFAIYILGHYTEPIPFDADPGYLRNVLEDIPNVGTVLVQMTALATNSYLPMLCSSTSIATTQITFMDSKVPTGPIYLTRNTANTRRWPYGSQTLSINTGYSLVLRMATKHTLKCPVCLNCFGKVYFSYLTSVSNPVDITTTGAAALIIAAITGLADLQAASWPNMVVDVTIKNSVNQDKICTTTAISTVSINIYSSYGNIPFLSILDASYYSGYTSNGYTTSTASANLVFTTNAGTATLYECSNQGTCDHTVGKCTCFDKSIAGSVIYRASSSDGYGRSGLRGDCGYIETSVSTCSFELNGITVDSCNGNGYCSPITHKCECYKGFYGFTCSLQDCPKGPAWFDEPTSSDTAHALATCSNMGTCDRATGLCTCRSGYTGPACEIRDCERDPITLESCNGHGVCVNTNQFFSLFGFNYGNVTTDYIKMGSATWDAFSWYHCLCSANTAAGFLGDPLRPSVGPSALITGTSAGALPLPGWSNWDCSKRNCPMGHTSDIRNGVRAVKEIQRILCGKSIHNHHDYFTLSFLGADTLPIYTNYSAYQIKSAIEFCPYIGNVTVIFPNYFYDGIHSACVTHLNKTNGGFLVQFETEFGDLPLFKSSTQHNITISEIQSGNSTNLECGGPTMGFCNRISGDCICHNGKRTSSDGTGVSPGYAGDCSYENPYPDDTKDKYTIFGYGVSDTI